MLKYVVHSELCIGKSLEHNDDALNYYQREVQKLIQKNWQEWISQYSEPAMVPSRYIW